MQLENLQQYQVVMRLVNQHREHRTVILPGDAAAFGSDRNILQVLADVFDVCNSFAGFRLVLKLAAILQDVGGTVFGVVGRRDGFGV